MYNISTIKLNDQIYSVCDERADIIYDRVGSLESYTTSKITNLESSMTAMGEALKKVQDSLKKFGDAIASSMIEKSEAPKNILSGEFWDEIDRTNMFLKNLK